jgi:hypothetical protein
MSGIQKNGERNDMPKTDSNRTKRQSKDRCGHRFWCSKCDACLVSQNEKCLNCGQVQSKGKKRLKRKDRLIQED